MILCRLYLQHSYFKIRNTGHHSLLLGDKELSTSSAMLLPISCSWCCPPVWESRLLCWLFSIFSSPKSFVISSPGRSGVRGQSQPIRSQERTGPDQWEAGVMWTRRPVTQESTWENILIWKIGLSILPETEIELNKIFMEVVYTIFSLRLL